MGTAAGNDTRPDVPQAPRRHRRVALALVAGVLLALAALVAVALWSVSSATGSRLLLSWLPGLRVLAPSGALLGDFAAERLELALPRGGALVLTQLRWQGLRFERDASAPWSVRLVVSRLEAADAELRWVAGPQQAAPSAPPTQLRLPMAVEIAALQVGTLRLAGSQMAPVRELKVALELAGGAGTHRIEKLSLNWDRLQLAANAKVGSLAPMPLEAQLELHSVIPPAAAAPAASAPTATSAAPPTRGKSRKPAAGAPAAPAAQTAPELRESGDLPPWAAHIQARGPLQRFALEAALRAQDQSLDARAEITPFAALPISQVDASTRELNLAALWSAAPRTAFSGQLLGRLEPANGNRPQTAQPFTLQAGFDNTAAGRWDTGRLPVRRLRVEARSDVRKPQQGELRIETLELGSATQPAGSVRGSGRWDGQLWSLTTTLLDIAPAGLDSRAPALVFGGPIALDGSGGLPAAASAPIPAAAAAAFTLDVRGALKGRLLASPRSPALGGPLALQVDASVKPDRISVRQLEAAAAGARAHLKGDAERSSGASDRPGSWHLKGEAAIEDFDPRPWWPASQQPPAPPVAAKIGKAGTAARAPAAAASSAAASPAAPRINADAQFDLQVPERAGAGRAPARNFAAWMASWRGNARAVLRNSQLAGVPLTGELALQSDAARRRVLGDAVLEAGGNRVALKGELDAADTHGAGDRWNLDARAPNLATLAPLLRLVLPGAAISGGLQAQAQVSGRWPALNTQGELRATAFSGPGLSAQTAQARWTLGTSPDAEVALLTEARQLTLGTQKLDLLQAQVQGTGRAHRATLRAEAPPVRPALAAPTTGASSGAGNGTPGTFAGQKLLALAEANGGWTRDDSSGTLGWQGRIQKLELRPLSSSVAAAAGSAAAAPSAPAPAASASQPPWLRADPFDLQWSSGAQGQRLSATPTRLSVLDAVLRLRRLEWALAPGQPTQLELQAELEPLTVAPLLARMQPDFGWAGDLSVVGRVDLRSDKTQGFSADAVLERAGGDLNVIDPVLAEAGVQRLGLSEARLAFSAREGLWRFTQQLAGSNLGKVSGEQSVRTRRDATWPDPESPIDGQLDVQVDNLGTWGAWVPAGWRLSGRLATQAKVSGRFGAHEYTGRLSGSGIGVRNVLAGVNLSDGEIAVALQGATARIERLSVRGGDGRATLAGEADLGAAPKAQLRLTAERFAVLTRADRRVVASGQAQLTLEQDALKLDGRFKADEGLIDVSRGDAPGLSDDVVVVRRGELPPDPSAEPPPPSRMRNASLNLRADLGQNFRLRGRGIDTLLRGELAITTPNGLMAVNGTIRTEGGTYAAYAQKLSIDRGIIVFSGPVESPRLDILALRQPSATAIDNDVKVGVAITGNAQNPRVRLYSEPEMADTDKLSWLVLGRAPDGLGRNEAALLQQAALALLAGEGESPTGNFLQTIGLDELSLRQNDDGTVRETVVAVGKQLGQRWYVGYERSLNATTGTWQLIYRVAQRFTVRAQSGLDNSLDLIWTWRWN